MSLNSVIGEYLTSQGYEVQEKSSPLSASAPGASSVADYLKVLDWVVNSLDAFKMELKDVVWVLFVQTYLELIKGDHVKEAKEFFEVRSGFVSI